MGRPKKENKKVPISATIEENLLEQIKEMARIEGTSIGQWLGNLIRKELDYNYKIVDTPHLENDTSYNYNETESKNIIITEDNPRPKIFKTNNPNIYKSEKGSGNVELIARKLGITQQQVKEWAE